MLYEIQIDFRLIHRIIFVLHCTVIELFNIALICNSRSYIMSYTYQGKIYAIAAPVKSISINKLNVVVKDQTGSQLFKFTEVNESKDFLAMLYQA